MQLRCARVRGVPLRAGGGSGRRVEDEVALFGCAAGRASSGVVDVVETADVTVVGKSATTSGLAWREVSPDIGLRALSLAGRNDEELLGALARRGTRSRNGPVAQRGRHGSAGRQRFWVAPRVAPGVRAGEPLSASPRALFSALGVGRACCVERDRRERGSTESRRVPFRGSSCGDIATRRSGCDRRERGRRCPSRESRGARLPPDRAHSAEQSVRSIEPILAVSASATRRPPPRAGAVGSSVIGGTRGVMIEGPCASDA